MFFFSLFFRRLHPRHQPRFAGGRRPLPVPGGGGARGGAHQVQVRRPHRPGPAGGASHQGQGEWCRESDGKCRESAGGIHDKSILSFGKHTLAEKGHDLRLPNFKAKLLLRRSVFLEKVFDFVFFASGRRPPQGPAALPQQAPPSPPPRPGRLLPRGGRAHGGGGGGGARLRVQGREASVGGEIHRKKPVHDCEMSLPFAGSTALFMLMLHRYGRTVWMDRPSGSTKVADARTPLPPGVVLCLSRNLLPRWRNMA